MNKAMYIFGLMILLVILAVANVRAADTAPYAGAITALHTTITAETTAAVTAQADTNATTTATAYTPRRAGDVLVGGAGTGTNAVWIAKGTSTNDWVQVKP